jgi:hypothetical protein
MRADYLLGHMTASLKAKLAIGALVIGGLAILDGSMLLGYSPTTFVVPAAFSVLAAILGTRWIRVAGICLCAASVAMGVHHFERKQHFDGMIKAVRHRAEKNSESR